MTAAEIAESLGGRVIGNPAVRLRGFAPAASAKEGDLTFAENEKYFDQAAQSAATAILVGEGVTSESKVLICVANPRVAFAKVLPLFFPEPPVNKGIHATAIVDKSAQIDPTASIGPYCVIGERASIGAGSVLQGTNSVGLGCKIGCNVNLFPNVTLYPNTQIGNRVRIHSGTVIGSDGFGYVFDQGAHLKVPQVGFVIIHDDVEIGANVSVDRGALGPTIIGKGTKIDNLVQIAHNVEIGEHNLLVSQVGIAGSMKLGKYVTLAGQVGLAGHLRIGDRATVAAKSGVMNDISSGEKWFGIPAAPSRQMKRRMVALQKLPELLRRVQQLEKKLGLQVEAEEPSDS